MDYNLSNELISLRLHDQFIDN